MAAEAIQHGHEVVSGENPSTVMARVFGIAPLVMDGQLEPVR